MMTDRELLEAAAKAAGFDLNQYPGEDFFRAAHEGWNPKWNPLADDGDALQLACHFGLTVECGSESGDCAAYRPGRVRVAAVEWSGMDVSERPAATRRAIVRAAAEMGRA